MLDVPCLLVQPVQSLCSGYPDTLLAVLSYTFHLVVGEHVGMTAIASIGSDTVVVVAVEAIARGYPQQVVAVVNEVGDFLEGEFIEFLYDAIGGGVLLRT